MPTVFTKNGFTFSFYANDHLPVHVHVFKGEGEAKFNISPIVELVRSEGLKTRQLKEAEEIIIDNAGTIIEAWNKFFNP